MVNREAYPISKNVMSILVDSDIVCRAEELVASCEACTPGVADIAFDNVLDSITGCDPECTDYVLREPARCPNCGNDMHPGQWRWEDTDQGRKVFILPGSLITLKNSHNTHKDPF